METPDKFAEEIQECLPVLSAGGVILYPTDTIWGIGCDALDEKAIGRIFTMKHRSPFKSMIILVDTPEMIRHYVKDPAPILLNAMEQAEQPTTAIFNNAIHLPSNLVNKDGSIAIRIASDDFCRALIGQFRKPIVSTSANISDRPSPANFSEIDPELIGLVDYAVRYRRDDDSKNAASQIIRLNEENEIERIR